MREESVNILIIGAGPSGCVAASYLQSKNLKVKIVEKSKFPRYVIGESLLPRCMDHFEEVGLLDALKKQNFEIKSGARFIKDDVVCNFDFSQKYTEGWDWTWQVPRDDFDLTLANEVQNKGIPIDFEHEVLDVKFEGSKSITSVKNNLGEIKQIQADFIIDSSGYGRVLPRILDLECASNIPQHSSIFTQVKDIKRPENKDGSLITFDILDTELWFWVIPFSNGNTSIGFVGPTAFLNSFGDNPTQAIKKMIALSPNFSDRFSDIPFLFEPKKIQNYSKNVKQLWGNGFALTGNSAEFLDPVFSSGVTFATESGLLAAKLASKALNGEKVDWDQEYTAYIKQGVNVFATYVKEWYNGNLQSLFFHRPENLEIKKQICAVLAGYVWDTTNPFVKKHDRIIKSLAHLIKINA